MATSSSVAKLAAVLVPLLIIIIIPCVLASRIVGPQPAENVDDDDGNAPTRTATNLMTFLPIRGGVVTISNKTAGRAEDNCSDVCDDHICQTAHPSLCGPHPDPNYCWVGCLCVDHFHNYCTCLCTAA